MDIIPVERFQEVLTQELAEIQRATCKSNNSVSDVLARWVARHLLKVADADLSRACGMQGPGEEGIDLFWVERGNKRVVVGQAEAGKTLALGRPISRGIIDKLRRALAALNDPDLAQNRSSPIATLIDSYNDAVAQGFAVEFWPILGGIADQGLVKACRRFENTDLRNYPRHTLQVVDTSALVIGYCMEIENLPYPDIELVLPRQEHFAHGQNALLCSVTGKSIAEAVLTNRLHIFETNARLPLLRSTVNPEIASTLKKAADRPYFWYFNNGLTILCDDYNVRGCRVCLTGAQIVNGCQTAYTLSEHERELDRVEVMCRIIRRAQQDLPDRIRRATNLQNAILERDLRSGDIVQKTLQSGFRRRGYFYERKREEYRNVLQQLGKPNIVSQFPKGAVDNLSLAQLALAFWHDMPAPAKMEKRKVFIRNSAPAEEPESELPEGFYDLVFHRGVICEELLIPKLVANYLYCQFDVGYRGLGSKRTKRYLLRTHGNLTLLACVGRAMRNRYQFAIPLIARRRQLLCNLLVPRFERPEDYPEYFDHFDKGVKYLLSAVESWLSKAIARQRREEGEEDVRRIFVNKQTFDVLVKNPKIKRALGRLKDKILPLD